MRTAAADQELRLTRALTLSLSRASDFDDGLARALEVVGSEGGWDLGLAWMQPPGEARLVAGPTWPTKREAESVLELAAAWEGPLWIENLPAEADDPRARALLDEGFEAAYAVPVLTRLDLVAVLQFFARRASPDDKAFMDVACAVAGPLGGFLQGKRVESELRASELRFRAVAQAAGEAIVSTDENGRIVYANPAAHAIFGWREEELSGQPVTSLLPEGLAEAQRAGRAVELSATRRDSTTFPVETSVSSWEVAGRTYFTALLRDISERLEAEDALRKSEEALRQAHALARLGSWEWDMASGEFDWSPELTAILGLSDGQAGPPSWEQFLEAVHPDDRRNLVEYVENALRRGHAGPFMYRVVRPDGQVRVLQGRGQVDRDADGYPSRLRAVSHDMTDIREFEAALERLNRQHALILASASEGITGVDAAGRITFMNPAAERMHGWSAGDALGRDAHETFHHTHLDGSPYPREECPIVAAFSRGEVTHSKEELFWRRDGTAFPVEYFGAPIREDDEVTGGVLIFRDRSEEERAQQQRQRFEQRLRQNERLESLGRLAGGVAHDFNNLLAAILSYAVLAEDRLPEGDPSREDVGEIRRAAERAASLTQQLLMFSRGESVRREAVDINDLIRGMEPLLRRALPEAGKLELNLGDGPAVVQADPSQIEQVLLNLVVNSGDALPETGGLVKIETEPGATPEEVTLRVRDDGEGMSAEVAARAFEPFFTSKAPGEGTGLGLATVYGVVTQSGGRVGLSSAPGGGTTITAQLPRASGMPTPAAVTSEPAEAREEVTGRTILLVEDDDIVRTLAARILSEAGNRVLEVADPVQALSMAERHDGPIHLLLTDMVMPQLSGSELARRVRERRPETAVLFMSGHPESGREGPRLLHKPFTPEDLRAAVRNVGAPGEGG
jgi:PAS domain S-box-containing protein